MVKKSLESLLKIVDAIETSVTVTSILISIATERDDYAAQCAGYVGSDIPLHSCRTLRMHSLTRGQDPEDRPAEVFAFPCPVSAGKRSPDCT